MADNILITPGTVTPCATDDIGGVHYQRVKVTFGVDGAAADVSAGDPLPVSGTFYQATQPVSISAMPSTPVTGTFWQATQPVSGTVTINAIPTGANVIGAVTQSGTWNVGSITTLPALVAGTAVIGKVAIDQTTPGTTNLVSIGTNGTVALNAAIPAGANVIGALTANQSVNVSQINAVTPLMGNGTTGTGSQRVTIASDNTAFSVNATPPTLTKATQGATGYSTQDLKDAGRAIVNAATAIAGVTAVTTEALLSLNVSRDGAATGAITTITVTSGKRFRVQAIVASARSSSAAVLSARVSLRMNPSGAVTTTSPILAILSVTQQAAALAEAGDTCVLSVPGGIEFSGTMQFGLSQVCSAVTGVVYASIVGYEY